MQAGSHVPCSRTICSASGTTAGRATGISKWHLSKWHILQNRQTKCLTNSSVPAQPCRDAFIACLADRNCGAVRSCRSAATLEMQDSTCMETCAAVGRGAAAPKTVVRPARATFKVQGAVSITITKCCVQQASPSPAALSNMKVMGSSWTVVRTLPSNKARLAQKRQEAVNRWSQANGQ
jgi:hypothetical protein